MESKAWNHSWPQTEENKGNPLKNIEQGSNHDNSINLTTVKTL